MQKSKTPLLDEAAKAVNTAPTDAQKEAGTYSKGHASIHGLRVTIENPRGSVRSGTSPDGTKWANTLNAHYGYFKGSEGADGDHVDAFFGDGAESDDPGIFVINQVDPASGEFDEHKVMFGYPDAESAKSAYLGNYDKDWGGFGSMKRLTLGQFKQWLESGNTQSVLDSLSVDQDMVRLYVDALESWNDYQEGGDGITWESARTVLDSLFIESEVRDYGKKYQLMEDRKDPVIYLRQDDYDDGIQTLIVTRESGKKTEEKRQWDYDTWDEFDRQADAAGGIGKTKLYRCRQSAATDWHQLIVAQSKLVEVRTLESAIMDGLNEEMDDAMKEVRQNVFGLSITERRSIKRSIYADLSLLDADLGIVERRQVKARINGNLARLTGENIQQQTENAVTTSEGEISTAGQFHEELKAEIGADDQPSAKPSIKITDFSSADSLISEIRKAMEAGGHHQYAETFQLDFGALPRGQGKRSGGMVMGGMFDMTLQGKKTYLNRIAVLCSTCTKPITPPSRIMAETEMRRSHLITR